jgi:TnpA family transposase
MGRWEQRYWGRDGFPETLTALELQRFFTPTTEEMTVVTQRRSETNRIAFALQLGYLKMTGRSLNSVDLVPVAILAHLGEVIGCAAPRIASIRALYRRRRTLFDHQAEAQKLLGRIEAGEHALRGLTAYLRREAIASYTVADLSEKARVWLIERNYLLPREREIRRNAVKALRFQERSLFDAVVAVADENLRQSWIPALLAPSPDGDATTLEWFQAPPAGRQTQALDAYLAKVRRLRDLGADRLTSDVLPLSGLEHFHRRVAVRRPAQLSTIRDPRRTLETACFLRLELMRATDTALDLIDRQIAAQWRQAADRAGQGQTVRLQRFRGLLGDLTALAEDEAIDPRSLREKLKALIAPFASELETTRVLAVRKELAERSRDLVRLLEAARSLHLDPAKVHKLTGVFSTLDDMGKAQAQELPEETANPFGASWRALIDQPDRKAAMRSYRAASLMLLKRSLKNRSVTVKDSLTHRAFEDQLIPLLLWSRDKARYVRDLGMPKSAEQYLDRLDGVLQDGLTGLAQAAEAGLITISKDGVSLPRRAPAEKDPAAERARAAINAGYGALQLSDVMVEVDNQTRFSWALLRRPARSEAELITLYVAVMALGSDLTMAALDKMVPEVSLNAVSQMVQHLQSPSRLRAANDEVVRFMRRHRVASLWGTGVVASADMMSLDATRHLWNARLDPRRKGPAIGTYPHVLDQWAIFYDQPIVLGKRQAGAAIEGALRQTVVDTIERVAVDTHGFTHFGMALAKGCGFDLCPRLASLKSRKLYLPSGFSHDIPEILKPIVAAERVSGKGMARGWDGFMRLSASVKDGWRPATEALDHYGSVSQGDSVYGTGVAMGKLLRTVFLCDYFGKPGFRNSVLDVLNQGEAVHSLQRGIHPGAITAKHGRSHEEMAAISSALTLLTNIVMAWNTHQMQTQIDQKPDEFPDSAVSKVAPISHAHINMRGILSFNLQKAAKGLISAQNRSDAPSNLTKAE